MRRDLNWFVDCAEKFNGTVSISKDFVSHIDLYIDASFKGMGACYNKHVYKLEFSNTNKENIANLEALNIVVALRTWGEAFRGRNVRVWCDNTAAVAVMNNGRGANDMMQSIARNLWLWATVYDVNIICQHIKGEDNKIADLLSRWTEQSNLHARLYTLLNDSPKWAYPEPKFLELNMEI
jgi:hypothetical protein